MQLQPSEEEETQRAEEESPDSPTDRDSTARGHVDRQDWQQVLLLRDRQGEKGRQGEEVGGSLHRKLTLKTPI